MRSRGVPFAAALAATALLAASAAAQNSAHSPHAVFAAIRVTRAPVIDGRLDDEAWQSVEPGTNFTQQDPQEGQPATERTELRITYDDESDADFFDFYLDTMHDHQTGAGFQISAAGVQRDAVLYNDTWDDSSWDSVWDSAVIVDEQGWTAELRIPLSQLRFTFVGCQRDAVLAANRPTPQVSPSGEFSDLPAATTILGAAKLTGKTRSGWSMGLARRSATSSGPTRPTSRSIPPAPRSTASTDG